LGRRKTYRRYGNSSILFPFSFNMEPSYDFLPMGFSRKEYWSGLSFPPPGDLPDPGIEPTSLMSPGLTGRFFSTSANHNLSLNGMNLEKRLKQNFLPYFLFFWLR